GCPRRSPRRVGRLSPAGSKAAASPTRPPARGGVAATASHSGCTETSGAKEARRRTSLRLHSARPSPRSSPALWSWKSCGEMPGLAIELGLPSLPLSPPGRIALPVAGHDAADRLDGIANLRKPELSDLGPHRCRVLVGARKLGKIGHAAEEPGVDACRLFGHDLLFGSARVPLEVGGAAEIAARTVGSETQTVIGIEPARDQDR